MIGRRELTVGLVLALGSISGTAHAGGGPPWGYTPDRVLFTWMGRVDREIVLSMRGPALREGGIDGWLPSRSRVLAPLPRTNGLVLVRIDDGRGYVDVIEQPNAWNGYTALIRILDPRGGADGYRLTVFWDRDPRGYGRRAPVWDPRWDDRRGVDPRWERGRDGRWDPRSDDRQDGPRFDPRLDDRQGYDPRRDPRRDPGFVWGRDGEERRDAFPGLRRNPPGPEGQGRDGGGPVGGRGRPDDRSGAAPGRSGQMDTTVPPSRQAKPRRPERRGAPFLTAPDQPPDSATSRMETR